MSEIIWAVVIGLLVFGWLFAVLSRSEGVVIVMICVTVAIMIGGLCYWAMIAEPLLSAKELMGE